MDFLLLKILYIPVGCIPPLCYLLMLELMLKPRFNSILRLVIPSLVLGVIGSLVTSILPPFTRAVIWIVIYLSIPLFLYRGKLFMKLFSTMFWMIMYPCIEMLTIFILPDFDWTQPFSGWTWILFNSTCASVCVIFYGLARGVLRIIQDRIDRRYWGWLFLTSLLLMSCTLISRASQLYFLNISVNQFITEHLDILTMIGMLLPLFAMIGMLSLVHKLNDSIRETEQAHFLEDQARLELKQTQELLIKDAQYRQFRHDIKNHLLAIDALGQKGEFDRQHEYIADLNAAFVQTENTVYCGHPLIDSLFAAKSARMKVSGIIARWQLKPAPAEIAISDVDLCALISNLLDNAIEACERLSENAEKSIEISLSIDEHGLVLRITNTCDDVATRLNLLESYSQKRCNSSGLGLKSVRRVIEKNNGDLLIRAGERPDTLAIDVYLPLRQMCQKIGRGVKFQQNPRKPAFSGFFASVLRRKETVYNNKNESQ